MRAVSGSLQAFVHAHPDLGFIFDSDGMYLEIIAPHEDLLYAEYEKLKGKRFDELYPAEEAEKYLCTVRKTIETGQPQVMEYQMRVPAGLRWFEGRTFPIIPSVSDKPTVVWISRDVTDRKATEDMLREAHEMLEQRVHQRTGELAASEQALRQSEQRLRSVLANLPGVVYRVSGGFDGVIVYASEGIEQLAGVSAEDWIGQPAVKWREHIAQSNSEAIEHALEERFENGQTYLMEYQIRHADGTPKWVEDRGTVFINQADGQYYDGMILDITPRKDAEAALTRLHAQITAAEEEYRYHVASDLHDSVGQKLVALMLNLRSIGDELRSGGRVDPGLVDQLSNSCADTIREIRSLCHGLYPPLLEERGLALPLAGLVGRYDRLKKDLQLKIPDSLSKLRFGKDVEIALFRICQEALNNAIRHSQSDAIRVELARQEDQLVLSVADNGSGLPDHAVEGLGLKTMRNRAEAVGGKLELNSGPTGTVVTVSLPFRPVN